MPRLTGGTRVRAQSGTAFFYSFDADPGKGYSGAVLDSTAAREDWYVRCATLLSLSIARVTLFTAHAQVHRSLPCRAVLRSLGRSGCVRTRGLRPKLTRVLRRLTLQDTPSR